MASLTFTASLAAAGVQARGPHVGLQAISVDYSASAAISASDVVLLCKLPAGARIHDFLEHHSTGATTFTMDLGVADMTGSHSYSAIASSLAQATFNHRRLAVPATASYRIPTSGGPRYVTASLDTGTGTTSLKMSLTLFYSVDAPNG